MTNIQAINLLKGLEQRLDDYCELNDEGKTAFRMAITALEVFGNSEQLPSVQPEPCEDAVSREAVSKWLKQYGQDVLHGKYKFSLMYIWKNLMDLPSVTPKQRWILCSEGMPENIRPVIVTWKNNDPASYYLYIVGKHYTGTACYKNGKWYWYSSTTEDMLAEYGRYDSEEFDEAIECIAWMPLPEPYREEGDE